MVAQMCDGWQLMQTTCGHEGHLRGAIPLPVHAHTEAHELSLLRATLET
jgi:hypothetical protein